jgi:hypothetical protein
MSNSVVYAMKMLQKGMEGQANMVGLDTEEAVDALAAEVRGEVEGLLCHVDSRGLAEKTED